MSQPVCIVTGGSSGIGLATAIRFASQGYQLAICGRQADLLKNAVQQIQTASSSSEAICFSTITDLSDVKQTQQFADQVIDRFGNIDVLVNNAAAAPLGDFETISADVFETAINTNIRSCFYLTQAVWRTMKQRGRGVVVNISSLAAVDPFPGFSLYGASKAWLDLITLALATEGEEHGLRVYSIRPGAVETPLLRSLFPNYPADQCVSPQEIADAVWDCVHEPEKFPSGQAFSIVK